VSPELKNSGYSAVTWNFLNTAKRHNAYCFSRSVMSVCHNYAPLGRTAIQKRRYLD